MSIQHISSPEPQASSAQALAADDCGCESTTAQSTNESLVNLHVGAGDIATVNADIGGGDLATVNPGIGSGDLATVHADIGGGDLATVNADIGGGELLNVNADVGTDDYSGIGLKVAALADAGLLDVSTGADLGADTDVGIAANADLPLDTIGSVVGDVLSIHLPEIGLFDHATC